MSMPPLPICLKILLIVQLLGWVWPLSLPAQEMTMEEVVVSDQAASGSSQADPDQTSAPVAATPLEALSNKVGFDFQRSSLGIPKSKAMRLRGFDSEKTSIGYDGRVINGAGVFGGYQVDWSMLPMSGIDRIAIQRGAFDPEYGSTLGGMIDLIPRRPSRDFQAQGQYGYKSYTTNDASVFLSDRIAFSPDSLDSQGLGYTLAAGYLSSNGYLRNSEMDRSSIAPTVYYYLPGGGSIRLGLRYEDGEFEMPTSNLPGSPDYDNDYPRSIGDMLVGPGVKPSPTTAAALKTQGFRGEVFGQDSYYQKQRQAWDLVVEKTLLNIDWQARAYYDDEDRTDYYYARADVGTTQQGDLILKKDCPPNTTWGWKLKGEGTAFDTHQIKAGVEGKVIGYGGVDYTYTDQNYLHAPPSGTKNPDQHDAVRLYSAFARDRFPILDDLDLVLGLRYDTYTADVHTPLPGGGTPEKDEYDRLSPSLRLFYYPLPDLEVHASWAKQSNFPIIPKHYWYYAGLQPGQAGYDFTRKDLSYEQADEWEVGLKYSGFGDTVLEARYYYTQVDDYLRWIFGYPSSRVVYNLDQVTIQGVELAAKGRLIGDMFGYANWHWQDESIDGGILADASMSGLGFPEHTVNTGLHYKPANPFQAQLDLKYVSERKEALGPMRNDPQSPMDVQTLDSYWLANIIFKYQATKHSQVFAGVENLFNTSYEETYGYPMPDRMYFAGIKVNL